MVAKFSALKVTQKKNNKKASRLPLALAQAKAGNTSENLLNEIRQMIYSLHRAREINKKSL